MTFLGATPTTVLEVPALGKEAVEGLYAAAGFEIPYEDTAKGKVKDWLANYKKMFSTDANTQAIIGYNAVMTFAHYANKAGKDLTGQKMLDALESGDKFMDIFSSPPTVFSRPSRSLLFAPSFRGDAKHRTRNSRFPGARLRTCGLVLAHHPGMTITHFYFGRIASAVPWIKAWILTTSASVSLPVKSGMPWSRNGPLNTIFFRFSMVSLGT